MIFQHKKYVLESLVFNEINTLHITTTYKLPCGDEANIDILNNTGYWGVPQRSLV